MKRKSILLVLLAIILAACSFIPTATTPQPSSTPSLTPTPVPVIPQPVAPISGLPAASNGYPWWNNTVFYEIFVRSFYDSNGDGIGDFNGIVQKLDYLQTLGVTGLWLMPINPSPSYHGYDVTDYFTTNPKYGTLNDFKNLLSEAHKRGIRVIIDLVLNHTSDHNPWFIDSKDPNSPYRTWYIWSATDPGYAGPWVEKVWYPANGGYYYAIFSPNMPDLNYRNPEVTRQMENVTKFWLQDVGVDGFRLDAAKHLIEEGSIQQNTLETHDWLMGFRTFYKGVNPDAMTVGEISGDDETILSTYTQGDQLDMVFDFPLAKAYLSSAKSGSGTVAKLNLALANKLIPSFRFGTFLSNHDQDRAMSQLGGDIQQAKNAAAMLLMSPGVPFIYYGEEIGMTGKKPDEKIRTPMQWNSEANAGFSSVSPWESVNDGYDMVNVQTESNDPNSLLSYYQMLISFRNKYKALRIGDYYNLTPSKPGFFAEIRTTREETIIVLLNLTGNDIQNPAFSLVKGPLVGSNRVFDIITGAQIIPLDADNNGGFTNYSPSASLAAHSLTLLILSPIH